MAKLANKPSSIPPVKVNMLGQFSITIGDKQVADTKHQSKKPWSILEYLITFRKRDITPNELIELIWADEESANPNGALKTLLFRSRKLLEPLGYSPQELIVQHRGSYAWNPNLTTVVDTDLFETAALNALEPNLPDEAKVEQSQKAINLYKGDFLPKSEWENWVVPISTYYRSLYQKVVHMFSEYCMEQKDYPTVIDVCQQAAAIDPYDEDIHYKLILSLYYSGNASHALEHYNHTVDMFYNEFAISPSDHFKELYKIIRDKTHGIITDLNMLLKMLQEETYNNGAFYCEYSVFRDIYQVESRAIERTGDSVFLCLLTVSNSNGQVLKPSIQQKAMAELDRAIQNSLRRGDVYTRYSISQYMILLPTASYEDGAAVLKRICQNFRKQYTRKDLLVSYSLQSVTPF